MLLSSERPIAGVFAFPTSGAMLRHRNGLVPQSRRSRLNMCKRTLGFSRNLGGPVVSSVQSRPELPGHQLQVSTAHSSVEERTELVNTEVPPSEGNEARRNGRQEVIAP